MKVLAFGASTSSQSINRQLAIHAAGLIPGAEVTDLDLRQFDVPIFSVDAEEADGIPAGARRFFDTIRAHDAAVISFAEHNGSYAAAFKNLYDWASRIDQQVWGGMPVLLLAGAAGGRGGASVLAAAEAAFPHMGAEVKGTFSLPSFHDHFDAERGITDADLADRLRETIAALPSNAG